MSASPLTPAHLRDLLDYDPETGVFTWKKKTATRIRVGDTAGAKDTHGYTRIRLEGRRYIASRLAMFWMTGQWPVADADHSDGDPSNDRWENLRAATTTQNMRNKRMQSNNHSGLKGIFKHKPGKWRAALTVAGEKRHLGVYDCPVAAHLAYVVAADRHFGEFARAS